MDTTPIHENCLREACAHGHHDLCSGQHANRWVVLTCTCSCHVNMDEIARASEGVQRATSAMTSVLDCVNRIGTSEASRELRRQAALALSCLQDVEAARVALIRERAAKLAERLEGGS
jgi:hypothetical protein